MTATLTIETEATKVLSKEEETLFEVLDAQVKSNFEAAAIALAEIKDKMLYLGKFPTFEAYCQTELRRTPQHIRAIIAANQQIEEISSISGMEGIKLKPSHVAAVSSLPVEKQAEVIKAVVDSGEKVTAKALKVAIQRVAPPKKAKVVDADNPYHGETLDIVAMDDETVLCSTDEGDKSFMRGWVEFESAPVVAPRRQKQQIADISDQADAVRVMLLEGLIKELLDDGESVVSDRMRELFAGAGVK